MWRNDDWAEKYSEFCYAFSSFQKYIFLAKCEVVSEIMSNNLLDWGVFGWEKKGWIAYYEEVIQGN